MAMVPERLCKMPTLMVSAANAGKADKPVKATAAVIALSVKRREFRPCMCASPVSKKSDPFAAVGLLFKQGFCGAMG
jgi:hypothetical protein